MMTGTYNGVKKPKMRRDALSLRSRSSCSVRDGRRDPAQADDIMVIVITGVGVRA